MTAYDEADFARTFFTVVLPLMSEKHVLLATSSPNVGGGSYTDVIFARDADGKKLMNSVILGDPCDMCKAGPTPEACTHKQDELASWKDPRKMARLAKVYRAVGGEAILQGELHTMPKQSTSTLFPSHIYSDMLGSRPKVVDPRDRINAVYVGIDPAGGGKCEFALTAIGHVAAKREFQVRACAKFFLLLGFF